MLAEAYEKNRETLYRRAVGIIHDYYEADDIVNETFLMVMMHYGWWLKLGEHGKIKYINSCCVRLCNRYVVENSKIYSVEFLDDRFECLKCEENAIDEVIERETFKKYVMSIRPSERRLIWLRYGLGMKVDKIANIEKVSRDCIIKRLSRSRKNLKNIMNSSSAH